MTAQEIEQEEYLTKARIAAEKVWEGILELERLQPEYSAMDYGNNLATPTTGPNTGITRQQIGAAVFDTANALRGLLNSGHATNLARLL